MMPITKQNRTHGYKTKQKQNDKNRINEYKSIPGLYKIAKFNCLV